MELVTFVRFDNVVRLEGEYIKTFSRHVLDSEGVESVNYTGENPCLVVKYSELEEVVAVHTRTRDSKLRIIIMYHDPCVREPNVEIANALIWRAQNLLNWAGVEDMGAHVNLDDESITFEDGLRYEGLTNRFVDEVTIQGAIPVLGLTGIDVTVKLAARTPEELDEAHLRLLAERGVYIQREA